MKEKPWCEPSSLLLMMSSSSSSLPVSSSLSSEFYSSCSTTASRSYLCSTFIYLVALYSSSELLLCSSLFNTKKLDPFLWTFWLSPTHHIDLNNFEPSCTWKCDFFFLTFFVIFIVRDCECHAIISLSEPVFFLFPYIFFTLPEFCMCLQLILGMDLLSPFVQLAWHIYVYQPIPTVRHDVPPRLCPLHF